MKETHGKDIEGEIIPLVGDVTKKDSVEYVPCISRSRRLLLVFKNLTASSSLVKEIESKHGYLDILINDA